MCFEDLLKRISPNLKKIAYKLNGHSSHFDDEDLYQEALLHLWQDFQKGKLDDKTDSYILQGCYFHLKNYLRKAKEKVNLVSIDSLVDNDDTDLEEILYLKDPKFCFNYLGSKMLVEEIKDNGLTKREKEVLSLCLEGLTTREIGKRLGVSHARIVKIKANIKRKSN
ncbi:MAG: sigma-70 family RNA polymerase sigma factor [Candidatus Omnitrophica bacterium]|nr:sigma-70 family RNA polymerase sigma factor [Candidatus Omnitrophota bacterium]